MRAPAWFGALSALRTDVLGFALGGFVRTAAYEAKRHGNIVVPAVDVGPELDARSVLERRMVEQADRDFRPELHGAFFAAREGFFEQTQEPILVG